MVKIDQTYVEARRGKETRKTYKHHVLEPLVETITASTREEAIKLYKELANTKLNSEGYHKEEHVSAIDISQVTDISELKATPTKDVRMKAATKQIYDYIPSDDSLDTDTGLCVIDQFVGFYSTYIKKLNESYFYELCNEFNGVNPLDVGVEPIDNLPGQWTPQTGVTPECLTWICEKLNISTYSFDVTRKCFIKHIAKSRNYPCLVYYCVNEHMYWITDNDEVQKLVKRARDVEVNVKSELLPKDEEKGKKEAP